MLYLGLGRDGEEEESDLHWRRRRGKQRGEREREREVVKKTDYKRHWQISAATLLDLNYCT